MKTTRKQVPQNLTLTALQFLQATVDGVSLPGEKSKVEHIFLKANGDDLKADTEFYRLPRDKYGAELLFAFFCLENVTVRVYALTEKPITHFYYIGKDSLFRKLADQKTMQRWNIFLKRIEVLAKTVASYPDNLSLSCSDRSFFISIFDAEYSRAPDVRLTVPITHLTDMENVEEVIEKAKEEISKIKQRNVQRQKRFEHMLEFAKTLEPYVMVTVVDKNICVSRDACYRDMDDSTLVTEQQIGTIVWSKLDELGDEGFEIFKRIILEHKENVKLAMPLVEFLRDFPMITRMVKTGDKNYLFYLAATNGVMSVLDPFLKQLNSERKSSAHAWAINVQDIKRMAELDLPAIKQEVMLRYERLLYFIRLLSAYNEKFLEKLKGLVRGVEGIPDFMGIDLEVYRDIETALVNQTAVETALKEFCIARCNLLTEGLQDIITDGWLAAETQLALPTLSLRVQQILIQLIPVMRHYNEEPFLRIEYTDLIQLSNEYFVGLRERAALLQSKFTLLDKIICLIAKPVSLEQRFCSGRFAFVCTDFSKLTPAVAALIERDGENCVIPYSVFSRDDVTVEMLNECHKGFKPVKPGSTSIPKAVALPAPVAPAPVAAVKSGKKNKKGNKPERKNVRPVAKQPAKTAAKSVKAAVPAPSAPRRIKQVNSFVNRDMQQPATRGVMPALDQNYVMAHLSKLSSDQADFNMFMKKSAPMTEEKRVKIKNAHEGAILKETMVLVRDAAISMQLREMKSEAKVHHYSTWLAMIRLMNALDLRLQLTPACQQVTKNDKDAAELRGHLIHDMPTNVCVDKLQYYLLDGQFAKDVQEVMRGNKSSAQIDLGFFSRNYFESSKVSLLELVNVTFADMQEMLALYERASDERVGRALQACIVVLGELYNSVRFSEIRSQLPRDIIEFMSECKEIRDVGSHNNVYNETFDPVEITDVLALARRSAIKSR